MQTLTELALKVVRWERTVLPHGAYRLSSVRLLAAAPNTDAFSDCSYDEQFADELISIKAALGLVGGVWAGLYLSSGKVTEVLALLME